MAQGADELAGELGGMADHFLRRDALSGRAEVEIATGGDVRVNDTTLVRRSFAGTMRADRDDPARASAFGRHQARIVRPSSGLGARES